MGGVATRGGKQQQQWLFGGGSQGCYLGPTVSEKISCDASSGADEASGYRSAVFRADRRKQLKESAGGQGSMYTCVYSAFLLFCFTG